MNAIDFEITAHDPRRRMPDADTDVLIWDASSPVAQLGAYVAHEADGPVWVDAQGARVANVVRWAALPLLPVWR